MMEKMKNRMSVVAGIDEENDDVEEEAAIMAAQKQRKISMMRHAALASRQDEERSKLTHTHRNTSTHMRSLSLVCPCARMCMLARSTQHAHIGTFG